MKESTYGRVMISAEGPVGGISEEKSTTSEVVAQEPSTVSDLANIVDNHQAVQAEEAGEMSLQDETESPEQEPLYVDEGDSQNHKKGRGRKSSGNETFHNQMEVSET
jgi:hypothetical protein